MNLDHRELQPIAAILLKSTAYILSIRQSSIECTIKQGIFMALFAVLSFYSSVGTTADPTASSSTASSSTATLLFRSNLGSGISLSPLYNFSTYGALQSINGTDKETGYTWPVSALGSDYSGVQLITVDPITSSTIGNYITNQITPVTGPKGNLINELSQQVKIKPVGTGGSQAPLLISRPWKIGDVNDLYITYWFKYQADLETQLDISVPAANWYPV